MARAASSLPIDFMAGDGADSRKTPPVLMLRGLILIEQDKAGLGRCEAKAEPTSGSAGAPVHPAPTLSPSP